MKTKFIGKSILELLLKHKGYPANKWITEFTQNNRFHEWSFRYALNDYFYGRWAESEYRDQSCDLTEDEMLWDVVRRRNMTDRKKVNKKSESLRQSRDYMARNGGFTLSQIMTEQNCRCYACSCDLIEGCNYELDHIMPIAKGGTNDYHNLQFLCASCNAIKNAKNPFEWSATHGVTLPDKFIQHWSENPP